ncbi:MAG: UDP-N-acetylmuramate dehydrogenase [Myxococcota bacterium]
MTLVPFVIESEVPLARYTTLELGGPARGFVTARSEDDLRRALDWARRQAWPVLILGGGSNLVVSDEGFDGLVVRVGLLGKRIDADGEVWAAAGERWDPFVAETVAAGLSGFECLSGIPGTVGATPIQNVGAYGQEVSELVTEVRALNRDTGAVRSFLPEDCDFAYRDSLFKRAPEWVVMSVRYRLRSGGPSEVRYPELQRALADRPPAPATVRQVVWSLRAKKSMVLSPGDPNRRSVGSFFTNPILEDARAERVVARALEEGMVEEPKEVPRFGAGEGRSKLSAAWLIERSGTSKGLRRGTVGVSSAHTLALVHHGGGRTEHLLKLAAEVRERVESVFGVRLVPEPNLVNCHL